MVISLQVYKEGENGVIKESSLEEIRSLRYTAAHKSSAKFTNLKKAVTEPYQDVSQHMDSTSKLIQNTSALQTLANCALAGEIPNKYGNSQYASHMESNDPRIKLESDFPNEMSSVPVSTEYNFENIIAQTNSILDEDPHQSVVLEQTDGFIVEYIDMRKPQQQYDNAAKMNNMLINEASAEYNNVAAGDINNYAPPKKSIYAEFNRSLLACAQDDSMTVNTREANQEIDNVFANPGELSSIYYSYSRLGLGNQSKLFIKTRTHLSNPF